MSCPGTPAVTFDYAAWQLLYPAFAAVTQPSAQAYFDIATIFMGNRLGPVRDTTTLLSLLNMLTAHIAWLFSPRDAQGNPSSTGTNPPPATVGRATDATEGSVSISLEYASEIPMQAAWFLQSPYGAMFWAATAVYRTFRVVNPSRRPRRLWSGSAWLYPNGS